MNAISFPALETFRLRLRRVELPDAAAISQLMTPAVSQWLASWPAPLTPDMARERIASMHDRANKRLLLPWSVAEKGTGAAIGLITVARNRDEPLRATFGYWLGEAHQGKGYMKELAPYALRAAFAWLEVDWIEAAAQPDNAGSLAVMRSCGMKDAGQRPVYASSRQREELCQHYELARTDLP